MTIDREKLKQMHGLMQQNGYTQDYATFEKGMLGNDHYANRKKVYDLFTQNGADIGATYEEFMQRMQAKPKKQPATNQQQVSKPQTIKDKAAQVNQEYVQGKKPAVATTTTATTSGTDYMKNWQLLTKRNDQLTPVEQAQASNMRQRMQAANQQQVRKDTKNAITRSRVNPSKMLHEQKETQYESASLGADKNNRAKLAKKALDEGMQAYREGRDNGSFAELISRDSFSGEEAMKARAKQQHEDDARNLAEYEVGGNKFTHNDDKTFGSVGNDIFNIVDSSMNEADALTKQQYLQSLDKIDENNSVGSLWTSLGQQTGAYKDMQTQKQKNRQDALMKNMSAKIQEIYSQKGMQEHIVESANKLNMGIEEYVDKYVTPEIMSYAQKALSIRNKEEIMPHGTLDYIGKNLSTSIVGMIVAPAVLTRDTRQRLQEGIAIADGDAEMEKVMGHKDNTFRSGVGTRFLSAATNMAADAGPLAFIGGGAELAVNTGKSVLTRGLVKAGVMKAGAKLTAEQMAFKVANMTTAQKILSGLGTRAATSSLNLAGYSGITSALNQASTGEDTSLKAIGSAFVNGAEHGAVTGGIFGISGSIMAPWVSKFGINGMETSTGQRMLHGAQKFGATAASLGVEAGTMMVADNITGDKDISLGTWLEDLVTVGAFKAGEPRNYANIGRALYGLTHNTGNTFRFGKDANGNTRTVDIHMTKDEQSELMNSVSGKNLVEAFQKVDKSSLNSKSPLDKSLTKQAYEDFMNDPNVSQSTKEKVNAAMGLFNTASGRSYRSENDAENKQILEYSKNGTLLTRTSYKTIDERDAILAKQKEMRDNDELISLVGQMRLKDRQLVDENGNITADAFSFMQENGYDINKDVSDPDNAAIISYMKDENSDLYQRWCKFADERGWLDDIAGKYTRVDPSLKGGIKDVLGIEGIRHNLYSVLAKDPMKRTDMEKRIAKDCKEELEARLYPEGKLHAEQSETLGRSIAEDSNLGTEQPNGEAVKAELNNLSEAESELEQFMKDNDVFGQNFEDLQKKGMTNPQIYQWMIENGLTEEQLAPFAHYINANARVQGMQNATQQKIEQKVSLYVQDWSHRGTFNGQDAKGEQVVYVQDKDGRMLVVGSGDMAFDSTNGRAKEGVGDMLVCLDPNKNETVYIKADEVTLFQTQKPEDFGNEYRQKLQQINSVPYNEAARAQAEADANKEGETGRGDEQPSIQSPNGSAAALSTLPSDSSSGDKGTENNSSAQENPELYKVANSLQGKVGQSLAKEEADGLVAEMENRAEPARELELTPENWTAEFGEDGKVSTPLGEVKMGENQLAKLFMKGRDAELGMIKPTLTSPDVIIEEESKAADGNEERPSSYLFVKTFIRDGKKVKFFTSVTVKKDGMEVSVSSHIKSKNAIDKKMQEGKILYIKGVSTSNSSDRHLAEHPNGVPDLLPTQENDTPSAGKDTNNSSNSNGNNTTLTFQDGSPVPIKTDSKGRPTPDYEQMTAEQAAEIMANQFGEDAAKVADARIKKAEKAVKDAEKMKVDYSADDADIIEQKTIKEATISAAKEQLQKAEDVKKALTAQKVKETLEAKKTEEPASGEGEANTASSGVAAKFQNAPRLQGRARTRTLHDGTKVSGHYEIVPAESLTPSHDVFNDYKKSEGFPVDAEGRTINDRDYEHDKKAQDDTDLAASKYDGQAVDHVPTVSDEGIVYDGNGRTMAGQKAAKDGTDGEYIKALYDNAEMYGFTKEQIEQSGIEHPRLVLVTDERLPYDTTTFAKFNQNERKTQSNAEKAVVKAKTLTSDEIGSIVAEVEGVGSLEAFFKNPKAINDLIKTLQEKGILAHNEIAELLEGEGNLSAQGKEYVKNLLLGSVFTPETIRMMGIDSAIKTKAVAGIRAIMDNMKLGDYSLRDEIDNAVKLLYEARNNGMTVDDLLRQSSVFDEDARKRFSPIEQALAQSLEGQGTTVFRDLLREYNDIAKNHTTGEGDMFGGNLSPEELVKQFLEVSKAIKNNNIKLYGNETERRNSEQEGGVHAASNEEPAKEARGAAGAEGNEPTESQQQVDEAEKKEEPSKDPMEAITKAAEAHREGKLDAARKAFAEAKKSGDEAETKRTRDELKRQLDEKYKAQGMPLAARQQEIAKEIGKAEAEKIDKPWAEMDGEERMFTAEKNPLTEDEIRNNVSEENQDLIEDAIDYLNGNHGFAQQLAYLKIYEDVRRGHENAADDSRAEDGTQLAPSDNGGSEGLELGTGRESRGTSGQLDRGTGGETASELQPSGENSEGQPDTPAGERGNSEGEGDASRLGGLSAGDTESKGSGNDDSNGAALRHDKGRRGSNRPSKSNARRKPAAKQGTTWRNRTEAEIKQEAKDAKAGLKAALAEMMKRGRGEASLSLVGLNSKQIEYVPELMKAVKRYGMSLIDQGIYKIKDWMSNIREGIHDDMKAIGFSDKDIDDFIEEMWNSKMTMDGETHTIAEWSSIYGNAQLRKKLGDELDIKRQKQMDAEPIKVKIGDRKNIEETLPFLLPQQQEDVLKAETQFFGKEHSDRDHAYGKGYMFTNGTGTGKTYTGLGIAKRLAKQGKGRILFITPSQPKVKDWIKDGKNLGLDIHDLDAVAKDKGTTATTESGEGMVITTYANMRQNKKLLETEWDAVIYDESHRIMENKKGAETTGSQQHYMLTNRNENYTFLRLQTTNKDYQKMQSAADKFNAEREKECKRIEKEYKQTHPEATDKDVALATAKQKPKNIRDFAPADASTFPKLGKVYQDYTKATSHYYKDVEPKLREQAKQSWKNTKTVFLSATPFNTRENLDYAEGYIFKYPEDNPNDRISPRSRFYMDHFGAAYRFRYNRLEAKKDNPDAIAKQEVAFSDYLQNTLGTMSGRIIDSAYDYSRDFPTVAPDHAEEFNAATQEAMTGRYLGEVYRRTIGNYNYGSALFETMKIANIIDRMKEHIAAGRKIVVFHRRVETKEPLQAPFAYMLSYANEMIKEMRPGKEKEEAIAEANEFRRKYADLLKWEQTLDYSMPREQIAKAFGEDNVLFFSGKESSKVKTNAVKTFNDDNSGKNIIVIQEASGKEGISLHDTTGEHQRVCITLALPQSPITALQIEGRTYRIGNKSNAIFEYPILGLNSEMMLFGEKFNSDVSTTENLALGSQARSLRESFANGVLEHSGVVPIDQQGVGGKEYDAPKGQSEDPYGDAILDYYSNQKLNKRNREGVDYFPTPEPLGYKMVEWANMGEGDTALEPSAGHGAIARYVPKENQLLSIEPSQSLYTKLQLKAGGLGRKFLNTTFENYDVSNKHDVVVMNPPFGTAGATAIAHLDKAFKHLDEGGRVVAIIPRGSTDKKFDKWIGEQKNVAMRAEVALPDIVFQQAGTRVSCRVVVLDKITDAAMRAKAGYPEKVDLSGHYDKIEDFFEDLRDVEMPDRIIDTQLKDMKKARTFKKDLESIKGISVSIEKRGISVFDKNRYNRYGIAFPGGNMSKEWLTDHYSKLYQEFSAEQERAYNENSKAALDEMKKLTCKLADMSEDEMQKYIEDKKNGGTRFREERGVQYSSAKDAKDVKNERIIPSDVDKSVSSQIEKKFDDAVESVYSRELTPEEKTEVERIANVYRNTPLNDEFSREENGNRKYHGGLETAIRTWEERATEFENYYGIRRNTKLTTNEASKSGRLEGVSSVSSESQGEQGAIGRDREGYGKIPNEDVEYYQKVITNLAAAKRALEYHQERTRVLSEQYGVKHDEWLQPETIEKIFNDFNTDKSLQEIYDRIKDQVNNLGIYFGEVYGSERYVDGFYRHSMNDIRINLDRLVSFGRTKQELASTILHEMLHPMTSDIIAMYQKGHIDKLTDGQKEAAKEAVDIFNELKQMQADGKIGEHYALTNAREMITELASPEWRNALAEIPEGKSLWKRFVNAVRKMLGFDPKYSKLGELTNTLDKLLTNFGKEQFDFASKHQNELFDNEPQGKKVTDQDELERLNKEKTFRMFSGMQEVDGKLYSPMAAIIDGKRTDATEMGVWMKADERPDLVKNGKFTLVKTDKSKGVGEGDVPAAYNPYMHTSTSVMNDQFSAAYARGNIKVVEWEVPESEKTSGYHAEGAKDSVGIVPWHSGPVNSLLPKDRQRQVMLSRWRKAHRIVEDDEVAARIAKQLKGTGLAIPWNTVTPNQLRELAKIGVPITTMESGTQAAETKAKFLKQKAELEKEFPQARFVDVKMTKDAHKVWGKDGGTHFRIEENAGNENSSEKLFLSLQQKSNNKKEYNETVTELASRVKQGTARIAELGKEAERDRSRSESIPAIAGKILNGIHSQGDGENRKVVKDPQTSNDERRKAKEDSRNAAFERIEDWAKENNCHYTEDGIAKDSLDGEMWKDGFEAYVYRSKDGKSVTKVMGVSPFYNDLFDYYLERNKNFSEVFPDTAIEILGYGRDRENNPSIIYKQPLVEGETVYEHFGKDRDKSYAYIDKYMESLGYKVTTIERDGMEMDAYTNSKYNVLDVNYENVIIDKDGKPHVIDAEVLPVDYKNDGKIEIKDTNSDTHFRNEDSSPVSIAKDTPVVVKHIVSVAQKVGGKVNMVQSMDEITNADARKAVEEGKPVTGWYDEKTGEVHLYMPNIHDRYTAEKTIWHETVGHKGMRELFGEDKFDKFLDSVWYDLDKPENAKLKELVMDELKQNPFDYRNAIEEGIARLAEEGKGEPGFWNNIKNKVADFLHELGYRISPNTKDVKYLLWLSKNLQKHPNDPYFKLKSEAVKHRLDRENIPALVSKDGVFHLNDGKERSFMDMPKAEYQEATDGKIHFRTTPSAATAMDRYSNALNAHGYMATESYMDNMLSLKELMKAIEPSVKRIEDIKSSENPYILQNTMQGAMSVASQKFEHDCMVPLNKAMANVLDAFDGGKTDEKIRNFNLYMITKHGLERNRVLFVRDYIRGLEKADADTLQKQWNAEKKDMGERLRNGSIDLKDYYKEMDEWICNNVDKDFNAEEHDYSGMHGLQEIEDEDQPYDDAAAIQSVMDSEARMESAKSGSVKDLWSKIHAATSFGLYTDYANGFQSRETYTKTAQMFDWYVPLRKFDKDTAEDVYGYVTEKGDPSSYLGSVLMGAKGRKSLSETNILAQIGVMGNTAIRNGGRNAIKQAFMRFARSHNSEGLITEGQVWLVKDGTNADGSDRWVEAYPEIPEGATPKRVSNIISKFEAKMAAKQATGDAKVMRNAAEIGYKFQRAADKLQHVVDVKVNGKTHRFYINGNPRAAQALNGMLENKGTKYLKPVTAVTRMMAQLCTSYSPEFVVRNIVRDAEFALSNVTAKEGVAYAAQFSKYYAMMLPVGAKNISLSDLKGTEGLGLYAKYRNGKLDMNNKVHRYFKEFMDNGGETGWVQVLSMKEWEKKYKRNIKTELSKGSKGAKAVSDFIFGNLEHLNEAAENMARFATYCASRDSGRSVIRSTYDAKEVSTNFNRHGSGDAIWSFKNGEMGGFKQARRNVYGFVSSYLRQCSMFFNAGIQSTNLLKNNLKNAPKGTIAAMMSTPFIMGFGAALLNNWMIAQEDEKERGGVKDPYGEMPDYIRRNNLCIYKGKGQFITIPLAIELRAFYGLGDLAVGHTFAQNVESTRPTWADAVGCVSQLVPVMDYTNSHAVDKSPVTETVKALSPSAASPFLEWGLNSDWKGAPIRRETTSYNEYAPAWQRAYKNTPEVFMNLNKKVNAVTNDIAPGNEDMLGNGFLDTLTNPAADNHFLGSFGGGAATFTTRMVKLGTQLYEGKTPETGDIPFLRSFLYKPNEQSSMQRTKSKWYNYVESMEKTMSNLSRLKSKNVPIDKRLENIGAYYKISNSKEAEAARIIEQAQKYMTRWNKMKAKSSDAAAIENANQNVDLIMQQAVEQLDKLQ